MKQVVSFCLLYECTYVNESWSEEQDWEIRAHACECDSEDENGTLINELQKQEKAIEQSFENTTFKLTRYERMFLLLM